MKLRLRIMHWVAAISIVSLLGGTVLNATNTVNTYAARTISSPADCSVHFFTFPTWFRGLVKVENGECVIIAPGEIPPGETTAIDLAGFIWRIVLNVIEIALQGVAYIATGFVIYGGFQYLTGGSNASTVEKARITLLNAVIGLGISMAAIAVVNLIFNLLG